MLAPLIFALVGQAPGLPRPTGRNGYEEYLQAAEVLKAPGASLLIGWQPGMKPPARDPDDPNDKGSSPAVLAEYARLNAMTPLEVRREAVRRFGRALTLVAQGNTKPVFDPRSSLASDTVFPELAQFRGTTRFAVAASSVYAADGKTDLATRTLLDQLTFADNVGRGVMISNLVGIASSAIVVRAFEDLFPRLSFRDAQAVASAIDRLLSRAPNAIETFNAESVFLRNSAREILATKPEEVGKLSSGDEEVPDPVAKRMAEQYMKLTPAGRQALMRTVDLRIGERMQHRIRVLKGPEKNWISGLAELMESEGARPDTLADYVVSAMDGGTVTGFITANVRMRAQLRLVRLYAWATAYRWEHGSWPISLDAIDPLSGEPFVYELRADGTMKIASKGTKETGEIGLVYRAPKPVEEVKP